MAAKKKLFGLFGGKDRKPGHICGGTTDLTDKSAPKSIVSKEIEQFSASFFLAERCTAEKEHEFSFHIGKAEDGELTVSEKRSGKSLPADEKLLQKMQDIIDRHRLVLKNGEYIVTAGLPPEYQPCSLKVTYASGETLTFTENNDPYSLWALDIYTAIAEYFSENGDESLFPERLCSKLERLDLTFTRNGETITFGGVNVGERKAVNGVTYLLQKRICGRNFKTVSEKLIQFPEDHFEKLTEIVDRYDLPRKYEFSRFDYSNNNYGNHGRGYFGMGEKPTDDEPDSENEYIRLAIAYENGYHMSINTSKPSEIKGFEPLINDLSGYFESIFG